jgi:hypothetical protein
MADIPHVIPSSDRITHRLVILNAALSHIKREIAEESHRMGINGLVGAASGQKGPEVTEAMERLAPLVAIQDRISAELKSLEALAFTSWQVEQTTRAESAVDEGAVIL